MKWFLFFLSLVLLATVYFMIKPINSRCNTTTVHLPRAQTITAELARTPDEQQLGLGFRSYLPSNRGMLFLFQQPGYYAFWMKDTQIPLDIIWINNHQVVETATLEPPQGENIPTHTPQFEADAVLEINSGQARSLGLTVGTPIDWSVPCSQ